MPEPIKSVGVLDPARQSRRARTRRYGIFCCKPKSRKKEKLFGRSAKEACSAAANMQTEMQSSPARIFFWQLRRWWRRRVPAWKQSGQAELVRCGAGGGVKKGRLVRTLLPFLGALVCLFFLSLEIIAVLVHTVGFLFIFLAICDDFFLQRLEHQRLCQPLGNYTLKNEENLP